MSIKIYLNIAMLVIYILSTGAFRLQWQSWVVLRESIWSIKLKYFLSSPWQKKFADLCSSLTLHFTCSIALAFAYKLSYYIFACVFICLCLPTRSFGGQTFSILNCCIVQDIEGTLKIYVLHELMNQSMQFLDQMIGSEAYIGSSTHSFIQ